MLDFKNFEIEYSTILLYPICPHSIVYLVLVITILIITKMIGVVKITVTFCGFLTSDPLLFDLTAFFYFLN